MRVLLICAVYPPENAPAGIMTAEWAEDLREAGHEVSVITGWPNHPGGALFPGFRRKLCQTETTNGIEVRRVWHFMPGSKSHFERIAYWLSFSAASFLAVLFGVKPDVVYSNTVPLTGSLAAYLASRARGARYVYGIFDIYPEAAIEAKAIKPGLLFRAALKMDTWVCQHAARIRVLGQSQKDTIVNRGVPAEKIGIVPLWLDARRIRPTKDTSRWRLDNNILSDSVVVLYAGTIGLISGAQVVIDTAALMREYENILFLFVGEGALKRELQTKVAQLKLLNVRFLPFQPEDRLNEMFHSADMGLVTLLPGSGKNSVPSKVLGYLAAGLPIVASVESDCDVAAYLTQGRCGRVCAPQNPAALKNVVEELLDEKARKDAGQMARRLFENLFSREAGTAECTRFLLGSKYE